MGGGKGETGSTTRKASRKASNATDGCDCNPCYSHPSGLPFAVLGSIPTECRDIATIGGDDSKDLPEIKQGKVPIRIKHNGDTAGQVVITTWEGSKVVVALSPGESVDIVFRRVWVTDTTVPTLVFFAPT